MIIMFAGGLWPATHECDKLHDQSNASLSIQNHNKVAENSSETSSAEGDHSACHICHLGHCFFTLSSEITFLDYPILTVFSSSEEAIVLSDFRGSLFRPPIS